MSLGSRFSPGRRSCLRSHASNATVIVWLDRTIQYAAASSPLPLAGRGWGWGFHGQSSLVATPLPDPPPQAGRGGPPGPFQSAFHGPLQPTTPHVAPASPPPPPGRRAGGPRRQPDPPAAHPTHDAPP